MLFSHRSIVIKVSGVLLILVSGWLHAVDIRYVSDQLTLKMYKDSALSQSLPSLKSGDRLEILQTDDGYAEVKRDDGTTGWVKANYLDKEVPAGVRLIEVQQELDDLRSEHTDLLIEQPAAIAEPDTQLQARAEAAEVSQQNMKLRMNELETERMSHIEELRDSRQQSEGKGDSKTILLWVILPLLTLISGFFIGFKYLDSKIKARFGGYNPI